MGKGELLLLFLWYRGCRDRGCGLSCAQSTEKMNKQKAEEEEKKKRKRAKEKKRLR